jgi:PAS domain S-box-containing protein
MIPDSRPPKAIILAPRGRDAIVARELLREARLEAIVCADIPDFEQALSDDSGVAVVTEEAMRSADLRGIAAWVRAQPAWSDLPFVILTRRGGGLERNPDAIRLSEVLGNVTFLERPFHPTTFISVARTAMKGRLRQFEARARIEELHEGEARLRIALLAGRLGSWELDLATGALTASATFKAIFGHRADRALSYEDVVAGTHRDDRARVDDALRVAVETGSDYSIEYRNVWPDGSIHWAELRARLVHDKSGATGRLVGVATDITSRRAAEETLRRINETLEERVGERTVELTAAHAAVLAEIEQRERAERALRQAQKMEAIGQLTGGIAHDFNNLLMAILGNIGLLSKQIPDDARAQRYINGALQGAERGAALTQRLLAFAHRQDLKIEPRNLAALVRGMTDLIERSIGPEIELRVELPASLPLALLDVNQVELAILNLAVNARDAMPDGGVLTIAVDQIEATSGSELPSGRYVRVSVSDTGHGMDGETLRKATEPFFSTKELGKGTGLGLSMIHGLAVQLKGGLKLASDVGRGTRAEMWLPVTFIAAAEPAPTTVGPVSPLGAKITVLVVDDDALIATSTVDMLEDLGHDVIKVESGERALEILGNSPEVDLVITDYSMPRMNGAQLAAAVRRIRPSLPILLATGYAELPPGEAIDLPRIGKPYQQRQLAAEIDKLMAAGEGRPRVARSPSC